MNKRIKEIRAALGLTIRDFGGRLHISHATISLIENEQRNVTDRLIYQICNEFGVNETWFRTGEGEMFAPKTHEQEVAEIAASIFTDDNEMRRRLVQIVSNLTDEQIDVLQEIAEEWIKNKKI